MVTSNLLIIGGGPGGYEMAAEAASKGLKVTLIERDNLGGTCLNRGCIPTKALCRSAEIVNLIKESAEFGVESSLNSVSFAKAIERKNAVVTQLREGIDMLLRNVEVVKAEASFIGPKTVKAGEETYTADKIVIATGSAPAALRIPGAELAITSDELLDLTELPSKICIIGGGVIGMEFAAILNSFGVEVTVIEYCKEILPPFDRDIAKRLRSLLSRQGINIIVDAGVTAIKEGFTVDYEQKGKAKSIESDLVLMAVGRRPVIPEGCEKAGIKIGRRGIEVDSDFMTSVDDVYAIGDVNGVCMLAHAASAQGKKVLGEEINTDIIPSAVFTSPECAMVGMTEEKCKELNLDYKVVKSLYRSNGKAIASGEPDGMVKMIIDESNKILGCHILGAHASDLIADAAIVMANNGTIDWINRTIYAHPTISELVQQAAMMA